MKPLRPAFIILLALFLFQHLHAQKRCATVENQQLKQAAGKIFETTDQFEQALAKKISARKKNPLQNLTLEEPYRIPVVVHVIHNGEAIGVGRNIPDEQIISQIEVLNKDFNRLNTDASNTPAEFLPVAGSIEIEFVLAKQDPDGQVTDGIVRVDGNRTEWPLSRESEFKALSYWPAEDYLNIWVIRFQSYLGYAQFPVSSGLSGLEDEDDNRLTDGVVVDYRVFGTIEADPTFNLNEQYNLGRSTTHEVGHFLGLRHIWGDDDNCSSTNDYVADTPNQGDETYNCPAHPQVDCSATNKMFQNYMDYTDDACMNLFTRQQIDRMITVLENSPRRNTLTTSYGLEEPAPGTIDVELVSIDNPVPVVCDRSPEIKFTVENLSTTPVTSLRIKITANTIVKDTTLTGLSFTGSTTLNVPFEKLSPENDSELLYGENMISIDIISINEKTDPVPENNELEESITVLYPDCDVFALYINASDETVITFELPESKPVEIRVYNMVGQEIARAQHESIINQTVPLNLVQRNGFYIVRLQIGSRFYTRKVYLKP